MTIKISNQKPVNFYTNPFDILPKIKPDIDAADYNDEINTHFKERYVAPLFTPINTNHPVEIKDGSQGIDEDTVSNAASHLWQADTLDVSLHEQMNEIYRQSIQYHAKNDWFFDEQLGIEALTRNRLPVPVASRTGKTIKYTASMDVIPAAKGFLAQPDDPHAEQWFANIAAYTKDRPFNNHLIVTMQSSIVFDEFKELFSNLVQAWQNSGTITPDARQTTLDFDKIDLSNDLSAAIFMPNGGAQHPVEQDAYSFTRMLMRALAEFETTAQQTMSVQPIYLKQVYHPENIVFLNLENYAHANASEVKKDWDELEKALQIKKAINYVSSKKLMSAKSMNRGMGGGVQNTTAASKGQGAIRAKVQPFRGKPIPAQDLLRLMARIIKSQITTKRTENTYKSQKLSYMRANRRDPDNINMPGKLTTTKYRPDIHVYLDTSGSISEDQYRDAIINLIQLTKRIDCNLYFTSFSHVISQTTLLKTKNKTAKAVYKEFLKTPKVDGGTDFENVWSKIDMLDEHNKKTNRSHQINFVITDFGYSISADKRFDPARASAKYTYYVPISMSNRGWDMLKRYALDFRKQAIRAGDHTIRKRMLM